MPKPETILALASGAGRSAIAVLRLSGPGTAELLRRVAGSVPEPRFAALRRLVDPATGSLLDRGLVLWFPGPRSFTGEDMAELHVHGGRAVVENMVNALLSLEGLRLAEPGEFARRAFDNGKIDLSELEGLADLVNAETAAQRTQALAQAQGGLRARAEAWRSQLLRAQALAEAGIDFSDEGDVAADALVQAASLAEALFDEFGTELAKRCGERLRDGFRIVIAGAPNAGKSSLLNALARRDIAIVSQEAGTTRDVLEAHLDLDGYPVVLFDTAGLREAACAVESEGVRRALARAGDADLVLWLIDASEPEWDPPAALSVKPGLAVLNKIDLATPDSSSEALRISVKSGAGMEALVEALAAEARARLDPAGETPAITRTRHRIEIEQAALALERFLEEPGRAVELRAEDLRLAARHLGRLTGAIDVEEVLGAIFGEFCVGK
jgi:tRNA modification GTPase